MTATNDKPDPAIPLEADPAEEDSESAVDPPYDDCLAVVVVVVITVVE